MLVCVCVCACAPCCSCGSAVYGSMADCSKHTVEEAGFDISGSENVSNPVFQVAKSCERTVAQRRAAARTRTRRGKKLGIHREWTETTAVGFPRGSTTRQNWEAGDEVFSGVKTALLSGGSWVPTVCLCRELHTPAGDSLETPPKHSNSPVPTAGCAFTALVGLFSRGRWAIPSFY